MKSITISEFEYNQLLQTIQQLAEQVARLQPKQTVKKKAQTPIANRLHGIVKVPLHFDEKRFLEDAIIKKHLGNG